jgi:hypothetical protein
MLRRSLLPPFSRSRSKSVKHEHRQGGSGVSSRAFVPPNPGNLYMYIYTKYTSLILNADIVFDCCLLVCLLDLLFGTQDDTRLQCITSQALSTPNCHRHEKFSFHKTACLLKARIVKLAETAVARDGSVNTTVVGNGSVAVT